MLNKLKDWNFELKSTKKSLPIYSLPDNNEKLTLYVKSNKISLMERVIDCVEFAIKHNLDFVELFKFDNSDFIVTLKKDEFQQNVEHIYNYYLEIENYEMCTRTNKILTKLKNEK